MKDNKKKEDLPVGKMVIGMVMLIFSPIIIGLIVVVAWTIYAMFSAA